MSQKVSYGSKKIDPVMNRFSLNEVTSNLNIYDHSIVTFIIRGFCLGPSNTICVEISDMFRKLVVDMVKTEVYIFQGK